MNTQRARDEHLLDAWQENAKLEEKITRLETALEVALNDCDHYRAEIATLNIRCDHLGEQLMEYRVECETVAAEFEQESERLRELRSKAAVRLRRVMLKAEMKPYGEHPRLPDYSETVQ